MPAAVKGGRKLASVHLYLPKFTVYIQPLGPQLQGSLQCLVFAFHCESQEGTLGVVRNAGPVEPSYPHALTHCAAVTDCSVTTINLFPLLGTLHLLFPLLGMPFPRIFPLLLSVTSPERHSLSRGLLDAPLHWVLGLFLKQSITRG